MKTKTKDFDCVAMKHEGAKKVQEETRGMSREEELAYWAEGTKQLRELQESLKRKKNSE